MRNYQILNLSILACSELLLVLDFYGNKSSQWFSDLTHKEDPWLSARTGLTLGERGNQEISHAAMAEYYGGL
jgi:uncharacterized phage-associated protein